MGWLSEALAMVWETFWALVLGFGLSGAVQAFVSRGEMQRALGDHAPKTLAKAGFFGVVSSSCSYAASALAKTLFARGADFTSAVVFMVASTNLVVELGIVLWLLLGWQFALAEYVGGAVMVVLLGLVLPRVVPRSWADQARARLDAPPASGETPLPQRIRSRAGWADAASYTLSDLRMLRTELVVGFLVAGVLAREIPSDFWKNFFVTGHGALTTVVDVVLGPLLAIVSFVCSVGNVPLAAALWVGGISFGGVVSFVFADLITLPLLSIYRRYYGTRLALRLLGVLWFTMSVAGLVVELLFRAADWIPRTRPHDVVSGGIRWNYTSVLDIVAAAVLLGLFLLRRSRAAGDDSPLATDPVCGMQVQKAHAPAVSTKGGMTTYFCCDGCKDKFEGKQPEPELLQIGRRPLDLS